MANTEHTAGAKVPPAHIAITDGGFDLNEMVDRAQDLNRLAQWISEVRYLLASLRSSASMDPDLEQRLSHMGIAYNHPEWSEVENNALSRLHFIIEEHLEQIGLNATSKARATQ